jgi:hypothetical protein
MVVYTLNEKEIERLNSLIQVTMALYEKVHSKKIDKECQKMIMQVEDNIYNDCFNTLYKIRSATNYLKRKYSKESSISSINILSKNKIDMAIKRIISNLFDEDNVTENEFYNGRPRPNSYYDEDDLGDIVLIESDLSGGLRTYDDYTYESHLKILEIREWIERSSTYIFLANLEELLNSDESKATKEKLLIAKNNTFFLKKWLDEDFLYHENSMIIPNLNAPPFIFKLSMELFADEKYNYSFSKCNLFIKNAINLAYMGDDKLAEFLLMRTYLKTYSAFLNNSDILSLRYNVNRYIAEYNTSEYIKIDDNGYKRADSVRQILLR